MRTAKAIEKSRYGKHILGQNKKKRKNGEREKKKNVSSCKRGRVVSHFQSARFLPENILRPSVLPQLIPSYWEIQFCDRDLTILGDVLNTLKEMLENIFKKQPEASGGSLKKKKAKAKKSR